MISMNILLIKLFAKKRFVLNSIGLFRHERIFFGTFNNFLPSIIRFSLTTPFDIACFRSSLKQVSVFLFKFT
ncbi:MAG: hypothetical protein ACI934_002089 [Pseudohongiellaceae bacterium]|jgi:hypothetical protein